MPRVFPVAVLAFGALFVTGCATMSEGECRHADWRGLGERDARQGRTAEYFADRAEACREHGLPADREAYRLGWRRGLDHFCTPDTGFRHGLSGEDYKRTCPLGAEAAFLAGYGLGRDIHEAREHLERLDREIVSLEDELARMEEQDGKEADRLRRQMRNLHSEIRAVERELGRLEAAASERDFIAGGY